MLFRSPLLQVFSLIFTVVSKLLLLYSTIDKTSRIKMKFLHHEGHPERFTALHGEEKREEGDRPLQYSCLENPMDRGAWCVGYGP